MIEGVVDGITVKNDHKEVSMVYENNQKRLYKLFDEILVYTAGEFGDIVLLQYPIEVGKTWQTPYGDEIVNAYIREIINDEIVVELMISENERLDFVLKRNYGITAMTSDKLNYHSEFSANQVSHIESELVTTRTKPTDDFYERLATYINREKLEERIMEMEEEDYESIVDYYKGNKIALEDCFILGEASNIKVLEAELSAVYPDETYYFFTSYEDFDKVMSGYDVTLYNTYFTEIVDEHMVMTLVKGVIEKSEDEMLAVNFIVDNQLINDEHKIGGIIVIITEMK